MTLTIPPDILGRLHHVHTAIKLDNPGLKDCPFEELVLAVLRRGLIDAELCDSFKNLRPLKHEESSILDSPK